MRRPTAGRIHCKIKIISGAVLVAILLVVAKYGWQSHRRDFSRRDFSIDQRDFSNEIEKNLLAKTPFIDTPQSAKPKTQKSHSQETQPLASLSQTYHKVFEIRGKPFPSEMDRRQLETYLSNSELMQKSFELLGSTEGFAQIDQSKEFHSERLEAIEFLSESLNWQQNPLRAEVINHLDEFIFSQPAAALSELQKKSWIGDKVECFSLILQTDPRRAREMIARAKGTSLERVLQFSKTYTRSLRGENA